mmetsp:Transcript_1895/g.5548  ORF Transcript_1895/g.5548 Transcript_1895/m.5548 type:complete len:333 (-) Transcript_1895:642-1640(-)|eukprot:CAMPEP_0206141058 /NCGR_PEP_ID=MMETSP1473-20131121/11656_1 /ASSEMBLY_ACC=CAM_ASM_001109 /TAXON_ID=1461547 /ORGANISM="Stichococcus sp, Strain RCC1054" /LENGTH=332 /DNA_ID=CAMNT_0053535459 /DNA_START=241 /DNA_END=1239 /DNA_ORIENTATION=+
MLQSSRRARTASLQLLRPFTQQTQRSQATLAYEEFAAAPAGATGTEVLDNPTTAVVIHGLLGQGRNWRTWSRRFVSAAATKTNSPWRVILVDQRCHGLSSQVAGFRPPHTLGASATDVAQLFRAAFDGRAPQMVIGHSLGGKVALEYLRQRACGLDLPRQMWVLDSNPGLLPKDTGDVALVMESISHLKGPMASRDAMMVRLEELGFSEGLRLWLGSNMVADKARGGLRWTFDLAGAQQMYNSYKELQYWDDMGSVPPGVTVNVVRAENSDRWTKRMQKQLQDAQAVASEGAGDTKGHLVVHTLPKSGHWVHVDNPDELLTMVLGTVEDAAR